MQLMSLTAYIKMYGEIVTVDHRNIKDECSLLIFKIPATARDVQRPGSDGRAARRDAEQYREER